MKKIGNNGSVIIVLLLAVILTIAGGIGVIVYQKSSLNKSRQSQVENNKNDAQTSAEKQTYKDNIANYSIEYPSTWTIKTEDGEPYGPNMPTNKTTLTHPNGLTLVLKVNYGGRGGACPETPGDIPHGNSNYCNTLEVLSAKETGHTVYTTNSNSNVFKQYPILLTHHKLTAGKDKNGRPSEGSEYTFGLDNETLEINKPQIGHFTGDSSILKSNPSDPNSSVYISTTHTPIGTSEAFYNQPDVKEAEAILRTLRFE